MPGFESQWDLFSQSELDSARSLFRNGGWESFFRSSLVRELGNRIWSDLHCNSHVSRFSVIVLPQLLRQMYSKSPKCRESLMRSQLPIHLYLYQNKLAISLGEGKDNGFDSREMCATGRVLHSLHSSIYRTDVEWSILLYLIELFVLWGL